MDKLKTCLSFIYNWVPAWLLFRFQLHRFMHHKAIPKRVVSFEIGNTGVKLKRDDSPIVRRVYWLGLAGWEPFELRVYTSICSHFKHIVEIGGNIGLFTVFGAQPKHLQKYDVYEPLPYNCQLIRENKNLNHLENVIIHQKAVTGDSNSGPIQFFVPTSENYAAATGGFIENAEPMEKGVTYSLSVDTINAVEVLSGAELIKIDVEGAEYEILSTGQAELENSRPLIILEFQPSAKKLRQWLECFVLQNNYVIFGISEKEETLTLVQPGELGRINLEVIYNSKDVIVCPTEKVEILRNFYHHSDN